MIYVSPSDSAWDTTRISREFRLISGDEEPAEGEVVPWADRADHPVYRYQSGASRFDFDTVREYMLPGEVPTQFWLRRTSLKQWQAIIAELQTSNYDALCLAIACCFVKVIGADVDFVRRDPKQPLSDENVDLLRELLCNAEFALLGHACMAAAAGLSAPEKKR